MTAWRNGIYFAAYPPSETDIDKVRPKFIPYGRLRDPGTGELSATLPRHIVACKYFDVDFDNYEYQELMDIPTPATQILKSQHYSNAEMETVFAVAGGAAHSYP